MVLPVTCLWKMGELDGIAVNWAQTDEIENLTVEIFGGVSLSNRRVHLSGGHTY